MQLQTKLDTLHEHTTMKPPSKITLYVKCTRLNTNLWNKISKIVALATGTKYLMLRIRDVFFWISDRGHLIQQEKRGEKFFFLPFCSHKMINKHPYF